jgi:hypothetical protein
VNGKSKQARYPGTEGLYGNSVCEEKARRHVAKLTLYVNFIVYFTYFRENVVVIICTNIIYNSQPYIEDGLGPAW